MSAAEGRLKRAEAELERAQVTMDFAETELGRFSRLKDRGGTSEQKYLEQQLAFRTASQDFRAAQFAQEIATYELKQEQAALLRTQGEVEGDAKPGEFAIKSPISGRVLRLLQESASVLSAGAGLAELGDPTDLEVVVDVLSQDAVRIHRGAKAMLEHWGGEKPLMGLVRLVEPSGFTKLSALGVEEQRVNVIIDFEVPADHHDLLGDGFRVEARIVVWQEDDVLQIPSSALFRQGEDWALFAVKQGRAEIQSVAVGESNGLQTEILDGLAAGDTVIVHPSDAIEPGVLVEPRDQ